MTDRQFTKLIFDNCSTKRELKKRKKELIERTNIAIDIYLMHIAKVGATPLSEVKQELANYQNGIKIIYEEYTNRKNELRFIKSWKQ